MDNRIVSQDRSYFTIIPNMIDDMNLSVYAFRLYVHMRRVTGDSGECFQSSRTLAKACCMSIGSIVNAKKELLEQGLINIEIKQGPSGDYHNITITDVWDQNMKKYAERSPHEHKRSPDEQERSPHETKKNPLRKPLEEEPGKYGDLVNAFHNATGMMGGNGEDWLDAFEKLYKLGATPEDINSAVKLLVEKGYTIGGPWSLIKTIANKNMKKKYVKPGSRVADDGDIYA